MQTLKHFYQVLVVSLQMTALLFQKWVFRMFVFLEASDLSVISKSFLSSFTVGPSYRNAEQPYECCDNKICSDIH